MLKLANTLVKYIIPYHPQFEIFHKLSQVKHKPENQNTFLSGVPISQ